MTLHSYANDYKLFLSDQTPIRTSTWRELRQYAMNVDYTKLSWFIKLSADEKQLVSALIKAQVVQGDMLPLRQP